MWLFFVCYQFRYPKLHLLWKKTNGFWLQERVNEDVIDYELLEDLIIHIDEDYEAGAVLVFLPVSLWEPSMYVTSEVNSDCMVYCIQLQTNTFNVGYQMRNGFVLDRVSEYFQSSDSKSCLVLRRIRCTVCMYRWSVGYSSAHSMCVVCLLFCGLGNGAGHGRDTVDEGQTVCLTKIQWVSIRMASPSPLFCGLLRPAPCFSETS